MSQFFKGRRRFHLRMRNTFNFAQTEHKLNNLLVDNHEEGANRGVGSEEDMWVYCGKSKRQGITEKSRMDVSTKTFFNSNICRESLGSAMDYRTFSQCEHHSTRDSEETETDYFQDVPDIRIDW